MTKSITNKPCTEPKCSVHILQVNVIDTAEDLLSEIYSRNHHEHLVNGFDEWNIRTKNRKREEIHALSKETHTQNTGQDNNSPAENRMHIIRPVEH